MAIDRFLFLQSQDCLGIVGRWTKRSFLDDFLILYGPSLDIPTLSRDVPGTSRGGLVLLGERGFTNWKKAIERFKSHERSGFHKSAVMMIDSASASVSVARHLNKKHEREMVESRHALSKIFSSLKYLAAQGLAIRGKTEETSNYRQLLQLRSEDSEILKKWLQRPQKFKCFSSDISNEVLEIMAHAALRELVKKVKSSKFYSVMLDETADISAKEQI